MSGYHRWTFFVLLVHVIAVVRDDLMYSNGSLMTEDTSRKDTESETFGLSSRKISSQEDPQHAPDHKIRAPSFLSVELEKDNDPNSSYLNALKNAESEAVEAVAVRARANKRYTDFTLRHKLKDLKDVVKKDVEEAEREAHAHESNTTWESHERSRIVS